MYAQDQMFCWASKWLHNVRKVWIYPGRFSNWWGGGGERELPSMIHMTYEATYTSCERDRHMHVLSLLHSYLFYKQLPLDIYFMHFVAGM